MKNIVITLILLLGIIGSINAQKYFTRTGEVSFFSSTPMEDIEATTHSASTVFDSETGKIQWAVLVKSFEFEKALMQEHFNENYMESQKYPKAVFKGEIEDSSKLDLSSDGTYSVDIIGDLSIHGVTQSVKTKALFTIKEGGILATCSLKVLVADYNIDIPGVVKENIAKEIAIKIKANYAVLDRS